MTITFKCKLLTPLFLTGSEKNIPEIRPSSIKGALRWWWRSMNGSMLLDELRKAESAVFGSVDKKSPLVVRTSHPQIQNLSQETKKASESVAREGNMVGKYLFFSQTMGANVHNRSFPIDDTFTFDVKLSSSDETVLKKAIATFWLLAHFGGLGTRSRRGGGNFKISEITDLAGLLPQMNLTFEGQRTQSLADYLRVNFEMVKATLREDATTTDGQYFSNLHGAEVVWAEDGGDLMSIGEQLKAFRFEYAGKNNLVAKAAFGLPLSSKSLKTNEEWEVIIDDSDSDRRASPVILREINFLGKKYGLILFLEGKILDTTVSLRKTTERKSKGEAFSFPVDNWLVKAFAQKLKTSYSSLLL